jgi:sugar phosphate isomerase/epimerase
MVSCLGKLSEKGAGYNVKIALECHYGEFIQSTDEIKRLIEDVASEHVGINYDAWHFELQKEEIATSIQSVAKYVIHTHIHDVPKEDIPGKQREDIPGNGTIDWASIVKALTSVGYNGVLSIELHQVYSERVKDHRKAKSYLENLMK